MHKNREDLNIFLHYEENEMGEPEITDWPDRLICLKSDFEEY